MMIDECRMSIEEDYGKRMGRREPQRRKGRKDKEGKTAAHAESAEKSEELTAKPRILRDKRGAKGGGARS